MEFTLTVLMFVVAWHALRGRYQRTHIALLGKHLSGLNLERHMETLTQGYARALRESDEQRQLQVFQTFMQTESAVAAQLRSLAKAMQDAGVPVAQQG